MRMWFNNFRHDHSTMLMAQTFEGFYNLCAKAHDMEIYINKRKKRTLENVRIEHSITTTVTPKERTTYSLALSYSKKAVSWNLELKNALRQQYPKYCTKLYLDKLGKTSILRFRRDNKWILLYKRKASGAIRRADGKKPLKICIEEGARSMIQNIVHNISHAIEGSFVLKEIYETWLLTDWYFYPWLGQGTEESGHHKRSPTWFKGCDFEPLDEKEPTDPDEEWMLFASTTTKKRRKWPMPRWQIERQL